MPAAPLSPLGDTAEVDASAVRVAVAVGVATVAVVVAAVAAVVAAVAVRVAVVVGVATVVAAMVVVAAADFVVHAAAAPPTLRGWIRSNCCWPSAQLREEVVEPRGERAQSGE